MQRYRRDPWERDLRPDRSGDIVLFTDHEADKAKAVAAAVEKATAEMRVIWERCIKWRAADVHAAAIQLGVRDGDPKKAEDYRQDAERLLRIAVDDRKAGRLIELQDRQKSTPPA